MKKYCPVFLHECTRTSRFLLPLSVLGTPRAIPFSSWFGGQAHTCEMEPLNGAISVVAADHLSIRHLMTQAVGGLVWIHRHVQHVRRVHISKVRGRTVELPRLEQLHFLLGTLWAAIFIRALHFRPGFGSFLFFLSRITFLSFA